MSGRPPFLLVGIFGLRFTSGERDVPLSCGFTTLNSGGIGFASEVCAVTGEELEPRVDDQYVLSQHSVSDVLHHKIEECRSAAKLLISAL
jgi:hypothetical protein